MQPSHGFTHAPNSCYGLLNELANSRNVVPGQQLAPASLPSLAPMAESINGSLLGGNIPTAPRALPRVPLFHQTTQLPPVQPQIPPMPPMPATLTMQIGASQQEMATDLSTASCYDEFVRQQIQSILRMPGGQPQMAPMVDVSNPSVGTFHQHMSSTRPTTSTAAPPPVSLHPPIGIMENCDYAYLSRLSNSQNFAGIPSHSNNNFWTPTTPASTNVFPSPIPVSVPPTPFNFRATSNNEVALGSFSDVPPSAAHLFQSPEGTDASLMFNFAQFNVNQNSVPERITGTLPPINTIFSSTPSSASLQRPTQNSYSSQSFGMQQPDTNQNFIPETSIESLHSNSNSKNLPSTSNASLSALFEFPVPGTVDPPGFNFPQENNSLNTAPGFSDDIDGLNNNDFTTTTTTTPSSVPFQHPSRQVENLQPLYVPQLNGCQSDVSEISDGASCSSRTSSTSTSSPASQSSEVIVQPPIRHMENYSQILNVLPPDYFRSIVSGTSNWSPASSVSTDASSVSAPPAISTTGKAKRASRKQTAAQEKENNGATPNKIGRPAGVRNGQGKNHEKYLAMKRKKEEKRAAQLAQLLPNQSSIDSDAPSTPSPISTASVSIEESTTRPRPLSVQVLNQVQLLDALRNSPSLASFASSSVSPQERSLPSTPSSVDVEHLCRLNHQELAAQLWKNQSAAAQITPPPEVTSSIPVQESENLNQLQQPVALQNPPSPASSASSPVSPQELSRGSKHPLPSSNEPNEEVPEKKSCPGLLEFLNKQRPLINSIENFDEDGYASQGTAPESQETMEVDSDSAEKSTEQEEKEEQEEQEEPGTDNQEPVEVDSDSTEESTEGEEEEEEEEEEEKEEQEEPVTESQKPMEVDSDSAEESAEEDEEEEEEEEEEEKEEEQEEGQEEGESKEQDQEKEEEQRRRIAELLRSHENRACILQLSIFKQGKEVQGKIAVGENNNTPPKLVDEGSVEETICRAVHLLEHLHLEELVYECNLEDHHKYSQLLNGHIVQKRINNKHFHMRTDAVVWDSPSEDAFLDFLSVLPSVPRPFVLQGRNRRRREIKIKDRGCTLNNKTNSAKKSAKRPSRSTRKERAAEVKEVLREQEMEPISAENSSPVPSTIPQIEAERTPEEEEEIRRKEEAEKIRRERAAAELRRMREKEQRFIEHYQKSCTFVKLEILNNENGNVLLQTPHGTEPTPFEGKTSQCIQIVKEYLVQFEFEKFLFICRAGRTVEQVFDFHESVNGTEIKVKELLWVCSYTEGLNRLLSIWRYDAVPKVFVMQNGELWHYPTELGNFNNEPVINHRKKIRMEEQFLESIEEEEQVMEEGEAEPVQSGAPEQEEAVYVAEQMQDRQDQNEQQEQQYPQEQPEHERQEPEVEQQEPANELQEPEDERQEPEVELQEPADERQEPEVEPQQPEVERQEPEVERQEQMDAIDKWIDLGLEFVREQEAAEEQESGEEENSDEEEENSDGEEEEGAREEEAMAPLPEDGGPEQKDVEEQEEAVAGEKEAMAPLPEDGGPEQEGVKEQEKAVAREEESMVAPLENDGPVEPIEGDQEEVEDQEEPVEQDDPEKENDSGEPEDQEELHEPENRDEVGLNITDPEEESMDYTESSDADSTTSEDARKIKEVPEGGEQVMYNEEDDDDCESLDSRSSTAVNGLGEELENEEEVEEAAALEKEAEPKQAPEPEEAEEVAETEQMEVAVLVEEEAEQNQAGAPEVVDDAQEINMVQEADEILIPQSGQQEMLQQAVQNGEEQIESEDNLFQEDTHGAAEFISSQLERIFVNEPTETTTSDASDSSTDAELEETDQSAAQCAEACIKSEESVLRNIKEEQPPSVAGENAMDQYEAEPEALPLSGQCEKEDIKAEGENSNEEPDFHLDHEENIDHSEPVGDENQEPVAHGVQDNLTDEELDQDPSQECYDLIRIGYKYDSYEDLHFVEIIEKGNVVIRKLVTREKAAHLLVDNFEKYNFEQFEFSSDEEPDDLKTTIKMIRTAVKCRIDSILVKKVVFHCETNTDEDDLMHILDIVDPELLEGIVIGANCSFGPGTQFKYLQNGHAFPQLQSLTAKCLLPQLPLSQFSQFSHIELYTEAATTPELTGFLDKFNKDSTASASSTPYFDLILRTPLMLSYSKHIRKSAKKRLSIDNTDYFKWKKSESLSLVFKFDSNRLTGKILDSNVVKGTILSSFFE